MPDPLGRLISTLRISTHLISTHLPALSAGPATLLWLAAATGWSVICAGLWFGLAGQSRKAALVAHGLSLGGVVLPSTVLGFGLLPAVAAASSWWWSLAAVTAFRPERLIDPQGGALPRLTLWLAVGTATMWLVHRTVL